MDLSLRLPYLEVTGTPEISVFFASYKAQMLATNLNLTLEMRVSVHRNLSESRTVVEVQRCEANAGNLTMQYFGADANEFYSISNLIQGQVQAVIREKLCQVPLILSDFVRDRRVPRIEWVVRFSINVHQLQDQRTDCAVGE